MEIQSCSTMLLFNNLIPDNKPSSFFKTLIFIHEWFLVSTFRFLYDNKR